MKRGEAVALLKELGGLGLIKPSLALIEQRKPDDYQLCFKGDYDLNEIESFLKKYNLSFEKDLTRGYLCIFKP